MLQFLLFFFFHLMHSEPPSRSVCVAVADTLWIVKGGSWGSETQVTCLRSHSCCQEYLTLEPWGGWFGGWGWETAGSEEAPVVGGLRDGPSYAQSREVTSSVFLHKQRSSRTSRHLVRPLPGGWSCQFLDSGSVCPQVLWKLILIYK